MRFDRQAFFASVRPVSDEESRATMAALVASCGPSEDHVSIEQEFQVDLDDLRSKTCSPAEQRSVSA